MAAREARGADGMRGEKEGEVCVGKGHGTNTCTLQYSREGVVQTD